MKVKSAAWWRVQAIGLVLGLVRNFFKSRVPYSANRTVNFNLAVVALVRNGDVLYTVRTM